MRVFMKAVHFKAIGTKPHSLPFGECLGSFRHLGTRKMRERVSS